MRKVPTMLMIVLWVWAVSLPALAQRPDTSTMEKKLVELVNKERMDRNLAPLKLMPVLHELAKRHSEDMASHQKLSHLSSTEKSYQDRLQDAGMFFIDIGENVATSETFVADFIHRGFMESAEHRDNILDPQFDRIGIGIVYAPDHKYYVTQDFIRFLEILDEDKATQYFQDEINRIRKKSSLPALTFQKSANIFAQRQAKKKATGQPLLNVANFFGETHIHFITTPLISIPDSLALNVAKSVYETAGIGTWFGRQPEYPGGTYLVALFLFPISQIEDLPEGDLVKDALSAMNRSRQEKGLAPLKLDERKSRQAQRISRQLKDLGDNSYVLPESSIREQIVSYVTEDLNTWPSIVDPQVAEPGLRRIGIGISLRKAERARRQTFLVTLIF